MTSAEPGGGQVNRKNTPTTARVFAAVTAWAIFAPGLFGQTWVEDTFEDFADGTLDAAGQNLYVSGDGKIRSIHRFDLNQDGYLDLMFNNTHDRRSFIPATHATVGPGRTVHHTPLAVEGSRQVLFADLNRDGFLDVVFCPNATGVQTTRRFVTVIYGGEDGWQARRSNGLLPVNAAAAVAVADLNADQWPDIVTLNSEGWLHGQPTQGRIIRIFWGGEHGFFLTRYRDMGVEGALDLAAADLDGDGSRDLAILTADGAVLLYWAARSEIPAGQLERVPLPAPGTGAANLTAADADGDGNSDLLVGTNEARLYLLLSTGSREPLAGRTLNTAGASHVAVGDLDGDQRPELVVTKFAQNRAGGGEASGAAARSGPTIQVRWSGNEGGMLRSGSFHIPYASATAIGDLDGDGRNDLAVAIHQGETTYLTHSLILFGRGNRNFQRGKEGIPTEGAIDVAIAPKTDHHPARAVFASSLGGSVGELVPVQVFWGGKDGFDPAHQWEIPMRSGYESSAADLNADDYVDVVALNSGHAGAAAVGDPTLGANIFWGGPGDYHLGYDLDRRRTALNEPDLASTNIADLNRDGYLDVVLGSFEPSGPMIIYHGGKKGFSRSRRREIESEGRSAEPVIADFNKDDWLDIAVVSSVENRVRIFHGGPDGFSATRQNRLDAPYPIGLETADLNADGDLDLIVAGYQDPVSHNHDMGLTVFWGSKQGFRPWDAQWLPGMTPISPAVADFDADGYLDIFSPHYHAELTRELLPNYLYWGSKDGFAPRRRSSLICDSAHDAQTGDFDHDGRLDLAVSCHTTDGDHNTDSKVFYNDGNRFRKPRVQRLPTHGTHWMWSQDMGHIYHRRWEQTYQSSVFEWEGEKSQGQLSHEADVPRGTELFFQVRSATAARGLEAQTWRRIQGHGFPLADDHRVLQYQAVLKSDNGDRYPILDQVRITVSQ